MDDARRNSATYLQPAFLICTAVLALAGGGVSVATKKLGLYLKKEPLPLKKPLDELDEQKLAPYKVVAKQVIENEEVLTSLGTQDYILWVLQDPREPPESAVRQWMVFITYYQLPDRVPHVPEECYTGGGYRRLGTSAVDFQVAEPGGTRTIPGRYLRFGRGSGGMSLSAEQFPVLYLFRVNGEYAGSRDEARIALNKNIFSKYSYFCKLELVFNQPLAAPTKEDAVTASEKLLAILLPLLEQNHWPDGQ